MKRIALIITCMTLVTACNMQNNPLITESPLPYGAPQFDKIQATDYLPAFEQAFREGKKEIDAIVNNPDAPTFQNTVEALEYAGGLVNKVGYIFYNILEANTSDELQDIAQQISPMETEFQLYVTLNEKLFQRVKAVYEQRDSLTLAPDQRKLLEDSYKSFERNGANLSESDKKLYGEYKEQLSLLTLQFQKNQLASTNNFRMVLTSEQELAGLPGYIRDMAAAAAKEKEVEGYLFDLSAPSYSGFMKFSDRRDLRERIYRAYNRRAFADEWDNTATIKQIVGLRYKIASLLGYKDFADYQTELRMVGNSESVWKFLEQLRAPALPKAKEEVAELNKFARSIGFEGDQLRPWDFSYYAEKQRVAKYDLTDEQLKPYFRLEDCIDAIFNLAGRLYGITFSETDLPVYHPDVKVYEVRDADGSFLALFYADFFPRASKRSGAWMTAFREQRIENGVEYRPFISLVTNFTKPTETTPSLITHDEFTTMLHEFGHSLHGMLAKGRYASMTGTNVDHDFVELPSQIMENWAYEKEYLQSFAKHYQTGDPLPDSLITKIKASKNYLSAYYHMRQLQFGILDMNYHTLTVPIEGDVITFEKNALKSTDVLPTVPECIISTSFSHIFSGGYAAGYYSYKWAEVLAADGFSLFEQNGIFDKQTAASFRHLLEQGGSVEAAKLYREFRGHDPEPEALLRQLEIIK